MLKGVLLVVYGAIQPQSMSYNLTRVDTKLKTLQSITSYQRFTHLHGTVYFGFYIGVGYSRAQHARILLLTQFQCANMCLIPPLDNL